jgi:hypothetical protein
LADIIRADRQFSQFFGSLRARDGQEQAVYEIAESFIMIFRFRVDVTECNRDPFVRFPSL